MKLTTVLIAAVMALTVSAGSTKTSNKHATKTSNKQATKTSNKHATKTSNKHSSKTSSGKATKSSAASIPVIDVPGSSDTGSSSSSGGTSSAKGLGIPDVVGSIITLTAAKTISGVFDGGNAEYDRGHSCDSDADTGSASAVFILESGATLSNVIIGAKALEGVHCQGPCTLKNVWFRDVCEDAISLLGAGDVLIQGGGAANAVDKVVQHNGLSGTVTIEDYTVVNGGKVYRGCGNCTKNGGPRKVVIKGGKFFGITADVVGINSNYGDTATIDGACGDVAHVCQEFKGVLKSAGVESAKLSTTSACLGAQGKLSSLPAC